MLFETQGAGGTLYLWQNERSVVIGRNQNPWRECRAELLQSEGGKLARRPSGGGAVYHDLGNLNFTFILPRDRYDLPRQFGVIQKAASAFGIDILPTKRNDLVLADTGEKISGNAFRFTDQTALHHGTILISSDLPRLGRYLVSREDLEAKGVKSVPSRVANLSQRNRLLTVEEMKDALAAAFEAEYGPYDQIGPDSFDTTALEKKRSRFASRDWTLGKTPAFSVSVENRFSFGSVQIRLEVKSGVIVRVSCITDAQDGLLSERIKTLLTGCIFDKSVLQERMETNENEVTQIFDCLTEQIFQ